MGRLLPIRFKNQERKIDRKVAREYYFVIDEKNHNIAFLDNVLPDNVEEKIKNGVLLESISDLCT